MTIMSKDDRRGFLFLSEGYLPNDIQLKPTEPTPYDANQTQVQKQIELAVTGGRGYLHLQDSLDIVNQDEHFPKLMLGHVWRKGLIPIYREESQFQLPKGFFSNPCCERYLGESVKVSMPFEPEQRTLLEKIISEKHILIQRMILREHPHILFSSKVA
jgi:hypothetical protein